MAWLHGKSFWSYAKSVNGTRKRVPLGTNDKMLARSIEAMLEQLWGRREWELLDRVIDGRLPAGVVYDHWRLGDDGLAQLKATLSDVELAGFIAGWRQWALRRADENTVEKYARQLRRLVPENTSFKRSQFTRKHISTTLTSLSCSGSTARRYHAAWSSFANYLVEMEVIEVNALRSIRGPTPNPPKDLHLSLNDSVRLVDAQPMPYRALAALREGAGVEISPALAVRKRDLDETEHTIHVHGTKNAWRDRIVMVEDWAWPHIIQAAKNKLPDALLFVEDDGQPARYGRALAEHRRAIKALELNERYTMHDARHSFAVRWMKEGRDPQLIANNLGHRDATMVLRIYGKYSPKPQDYRRSVGGGNR